MIRRGFLWLTMVMFALLPLSGCRSVNPTERSQDGKLNIVATTSIVADVVRQVAGDKINLVELLPAGADPHTFEPRPQDVASIADASLVFASGAGLEEFLKPLLASAGATDRVVEVSAGITLLSFTGQDVPVGGEQEHADGDPHTWMDPNNVIIWTGNIASALSRADPVHADVYAANAQAYISTLRDLDTWIRQQVEPLPASRRKLVTDHRSLAYFARTYGFELVGQVVGSFSTAAQPSAQEFATLQDEIKKFAVPAIFLDSTANPLLAEQLSQDTGIHVVRIYTGSLSAVDGPAADYVSMMRYNVSAIVAALKA